MWKKLQGILVASKGLKGFVVSFVLGAVCNLGHAPFFIWPAFLFCFALFLLRLDGAAGFEKLVTAGFWRGFSFGLGYFLFGFYWIGSAFIARGPDFIPYMPFAVLLFSAGLALFWGVAGALYVKITRGSTSLLRAPVFAAVFFLAEYARGHVFGGLPWNLPGYIFEAGKPVSQFASLVGIYGLSAVTLFISAALALALTSTRQSHKPVVSGILVLSLVWVFGFVRLQNANIQFVDNVKLRIVHANIPQRDKFDPGKYVETISHYLRLSRSAGFEDVTHIIWPEGAVPGLMFRDQELMRVLDETFRSGPVQPPVFITQTLRVEERPDNQKPLYYNSAASMTFSDGETPHISEFYDKRKLVPFGEFIPGGGLAEKLGLSSLSSALESMTPAKNRFVPEIPGLPPVSIQICYEIIFPGFTPDQLPGTGRKPEWILNLSNDSWYGNSTGPRQHINQVGYRAIEEGLPIVRATSGGISGVLDGYGRLGASFGLTEDGALDVLLPRANLQNTYKSWINHIMVLIILVTLITCGRGMRLVN